MARPKVRVSYRKSEGVWIQNTQGMRAGEGIYPTKKQAVDESRKLAKRKGATLTIERQDGTVQDTFEYGTQRSTSSESILDRMF